MIKSESALATRRTVACLFPRNTDAIVALKAQIPADWTLVESDAADPACALREAFGLHPDTDVLLVRADARLPAHAIARLQLARTAQPDAQVWTPLCAQTPALDPKPPQIDVDAETVDRWAWLLSDRAYVQTAHCSPLLSLWRGDTLRTLIDQNLEPYAAHPAITCIRVCDTVFVSNRELAPKTSNGQTQISAERLRGMIRDVNHLPAPPAIGFDGNPVLLHVLHGWGGGAARFVDDLISSDETHRHLVLIAHGSSKRRVHGESIELRTSTTGPLLRQWAMSAPASATHLMSAEYKSLLSSVCADFGVAGLLISSLIGHSLDALRTGLPTSVVCHDYYPIWPILHANFDDGDLDFSTTGIAHALDAVKGRLPFLESRAEYWQQLRHAYLLALANIDGTLVNPSDCVRDNLCRIAPELAQRRWQRIGHGLAAFPEPTPAIAPDPQRAALRVLVLGRINGGKGEELLAELIPQFPANVELILLGCGAAGMRFFGHSQIHVQLDYQREQLPDLLARLMPDVALLPTTVAETFSYTLSELRALGVPVIATNRGSFVERITHGSDGLLVAADAGAIALLLHQLSNDCGPLSALRKRVPSESLSAMTQTYAAALALQPRAPWPSTLCDPLIRHQLQNAQILLRREVEGRQSLEAASKTQQIELERRADWANREARTAAERLKWANSLQADVMSARELVIDTQALLDVSDAELKATGQRAADLVDQLDRQAQQFAAHSSAEAAAFASEREQLSSYVASLIEQRDHFIAERDHILASSSWRLTRPLRIVRRLFSRLIGGTLTRLKFRASRLGAIRKRIANSLRVRGLTGTWRRLRQEASTSKASDIYAIPARPTGNEEIPDVDDIVLTLPSAPRASVIVPVYNHLHHTITCLRALATQAQLTPFEVIVVDDCSSDASRDLLPKIPGIRYVRNAQNLGFIGACNAGAKMAESEYLIFLNNDTAVQANWLDALIDTFSTHRDVGLVGAKLVYPDGRLQEAGGIVFNDGSGWNYGRFDDPADPRYNFVREADYCSGAAIAISAELFNSLGQFDSHYAPAYYEDTDLAMKVRAAGKRVLYQPASVVVHFEGVSSGTDTSSGVKAYQVVNQQKFLARWSEALDGHASSPPSMPIEVARQHRARRHVLVIDATVPQPDQDSGSVRLVNLLRLLVEDGCAVTFFADNRAYLAGYVENLQQLGVEVLWHPWLNDPVSWFAENGARFHSVLVSRHYIACSYLDLVRRHAPQAKFIFDTVDLHYLREQRAAELADRADLAKTALQTRKQELDVIARSDITLVVSPVEQALLATDAPGARVEVLSNVHEVFGCRRDFAERRDVMFIGGFQHPPNVDAATWFVGEVWPLVRSELPAMQFHLIGSKAPDAVKALGDEQGVVFHGFVENIEPFLDGCRLAVAPLRYGAGVKGKVNMSMSYGQPVVATPVAVEGMHLRAEDDVLVAESPRAFADALIRLYQDESLWNQLSENGIDNVRRHFGFDAARAVIRQLLE